MNQPAKPSAMIGARWCQLDGLYVHPGGTSGPGFIMAMWWAMPGIIGTRIDSAMAHAPTNATIQRPQKSVRGDGHSETAPNRTRSPPLVTSFQVIALERYPNVAG